METDLSLITEPQTKIEGDSLVTYSVVKSVIQLTEVRTRIEMLEIPLPSEKTLLENARLGIVHPYYQPGREAELADLKSKLPVKGE